MNEQTAQHKITVSYYVVPAKKTLKLTISEIVKNV